MMLYNVCTFICQGWKLTVVLWPEATVFSVGPQDFKKWWSDRPPDFLTDFALHLELQIIEFVHISWKSSRYFERIEISFSPFKFLGCLFERWLGSGLLLPWYLKLILNTIRYPNLSPWMHFVIIEISLICSFQSFY